MSTYETLQDLFVLVVFIVLFVIIFRIWALERRAMSDIIKAMKEEMDREKKFWESGNRRSDKCCICGSQAIARVAYSSNSYCEYHWQHLLEANDGSAK